MLFLLSSFDKGGCKKVVRKVVGYLCLHPCSRVIRKQSNQKHSNQKHIRPILASNLAMKVSRII